MAMVHSQRAVKLEEPLEDGTTHRYEPIEDQPVKKRAAAGAPARRGSTKTRKGKAAKAASEEGEEGEGGEGGDDTEGEAEGEERSNAGGGEGSENLDPALTAGDNLPDQSTNVDPSAAEGDATAVVTDINPSTAEAQAHFNENDFLKQLQAMEATALAEAKQTDGDDTLPIASSLQFVPPPPPAPEGDLEVGGSAGKRAREEDGAEQSQEQTKKQRVVQQDGDIAVGGDDIEVPLVEGAEGDGSYERTRV